MMLRADDATSDEAMRDRAPGHASNAAPTARAVAEVLTRPEALAPWRTALEDLASRAIEPNPLHEPHALEPALDELAAGHDLSALLLVDGAVPGRLIGFLPLRRQRLHRLLPSVVLRTLDHPYAFCHIPLIDRHAVTEVVGSLATWLRSMPGLAIDLKALDREGPLWRALTDGLVESGVPHLAHGSSQRALLVPKASASTYLAQALTKKRRKELGRQGRRLADQGTVAYRRLAADDDIDTWIDAFLTLEQSGWKGAAGTAMASLPGHRRFFQRLMRGAHALGQAQMSGLYIDDRPVAMKCNLISAGTPSAAFAFKIAYDEALESLSPGVQLELEQIRELHEESNVIAWMDSCAAEDHFMINRLWTERRRLASLLIAAPNPAGRLLIASLVTARQLRDRVHMARRAGTDIDT